MALPRGALVSVVAVCLAPLACGCVGSSGAQRPASGPVSSIRPAPAATPTSHGHESVTLIVHGMGCPLCANNVDKQLLKVPGVDKVDVDLGTGAVRVAFQAGAAYPGHAPLEKAVANSGYTLVRIQTP